MNGTYFLGIGIGAVICTGLFAWKLRRAGLRSACALTALPMALVLGLVCSKLFHYLMKLPGQYDNYGLAGLLRTRPAEFSFVGGCIGVVLAVLLAAKLCGHRAFPVLDAFAPCGALMAAFMRACEGLLDPLALVGVGDYVENEALWFFPVSVDTEMYGVFYAVFMLEAICALICALAAFLLSHRGGFKEGRVFLHTLFFLALPQIFSERMLNQCMKWGFVRIEQLMCAVIVFAVILYACVKRGKPAAFVPLLLDLLCVGVIICIEFTLDNKPPFGIELPTVTCYILMILTLCCMAGLEVYAYHRLNKEK